MDNGSKQYTPHDVPIIQITPSEKIEEDILNTDNTIVLDNKAEIK